MTITHDECREQVAGGPPVDAAAEQHLRSCDRCRTFAAAVAELDARASAALAPPPPPAGLADRVMERVAVRAPAPNAHDATRRWTLTRLRAAVAVAAAILLVGGVASSYVMRDTTDDDREMLLAAATHFEDDGPSQVTVDATADIEVAADGRNPDFSGVPAEVRDYMAAEWDRMMAQLDAQLAELEARIDEMLDQFEGRIDRPGGPGSPPRTAPRAPAAPQAPEAPRAPTAASLGLRITATGTVDADAGVQLDGQVTPVGGTIAVEGSPADFAVDASARGRAVRGPDGAWLAADAGTGPLGAVFLDGRAIPSILRAAEGDVRADGGRYTFRVRAGAIGAGDARWTASARLDERGRVREVVLTPEGAGPSPTRTTMTISIGGRSSLDPSRSPVNVTGRAATDASSPLAPIAPAVRAALRAGR
jgi:hypothetical protein